MEFEPRFKQPLNHADAVAYVQFTTQHAPVEGVGNLEGHEVRGDAGDVLGNSGLEGGLSIVRVILFKQPLDRQACIADQRPIHAHPTVSASLISRASRIKPAELPGRGLPPNTSCRSSANSSWSGLSDNSPAMPLASSFVDSRSMAAWQYPRSSHPGDERRELPPQAGQDGCSPTACQQPHRHLDRSPLDPSKRVSKSI